MSGPLAGVRVIDISTPRGEMCGRVLADLGATVVKIEPAEGCATRSLPPFIDGRAGDADASLYWATVGRGKQSLVVDLADRARLDAELANADVFIESHDPGTLEAFGLGVAQLRARHPHLVHVSITPFGQDGPKAHWPATDLTLEAAGGLIGLQGDRDRAPIPVGYPQASLHAGVTAAADTVIALRAGGGQHLDVSMQAAVVWTLMNATGFPPMVGRDPPGTGEERSQPAPEMVPGAPLPRTVRCRDGYVVLSLHQPVVGERTLAALIDKARRDGRLPAALHAVNLEHWVTAFRAGELTPETLRLAFATLVDVIANETKASLQRLAIEQRALIAAVRELPDLLTDPQLAARDFWQSVDGRRHPGAFARLSATPLPSTPSAPKLGQHARTVTRRPTTSQPRLAAFEGLKVADFAWVGVGPIISKALADHGATVVHVESEARPDILRNAAPYRDGVAGPDRSFFFANFNTSKLGITLDLGTDGGRDVGRRLIDWADVVLESFTPGTLARMGLGYEAMSASRRDLVMLSTCMRGQTGPEASYSGFGNQGAALAGLVGITGWPDRPPAGPWGAYTDFIAPRFGVAAMAAALWHRDRTGEGQHIDLSQIEAGIRFMEPLVLDYTVNGRTTGAAGHDSMYACPHGVYHCVGHERYVAIAVETTAQWRALVGVLGAAELTDAALDTVTARRAIRPRIDAAITAFCASDGAFEIAARLLAAGVPAHAVMRPTDLHADAQLAARGFFCNLQHGQIGLAPFDGLVTRFSALRAGPLFAAPLRGEHTHEVLREMLGYDDEAIAALAAAGALR